MATEPAAITVRGIKKSYKKVSVLKGIDFSLQKGTIFALLGANGAGKTTTINILATLLKADAGSAEVYGYDINRQADMVRQKISLTGQFAAVDEILTGRENLIMIAQLRHISQPEKIADELLTTFGLNDAANRPVITYSGGMRRRLDIAMSLIGNPPLIFLDEPTTGLDPQSRNAMWHIIRNLAKSGTTVFLTTQYLEEADRLASHIAILKDGKIIAQGTPAELKKLLTGGRIMITFADETSLKLGQKLFKLYKVDVDIAQLSLSITTNGSLEELTNILAELRRNHLNVVEFSQKTPSLDDVFLAIVGDKPMKETV